MYEDFGQNCKNYAFRADLENSMCPMNSRFPDLCCTAQDLFNDNFEILERLFLTELRKIKNWNIFFKMGPQRAHFLIHSDFSKFWRFRSKSHFCAIFQTFVKSFIFDKKILIFSPVKA